MWILPCISVGMSIHIRLEKDTQDKLQRFAHLRRSNMSAIIRYALDKLFEEEEVDPTGERILKGILDPLFKIPRGYKLRSFYLTLYMLGRKYPYDSSMEYWGPGVYLSPYDMTHKEVMGFIQAKQQEAIEHGKAA